MSLFSSVFSFASICLMFREKHLFSSQHSRNDKSGNNMNCININVGLLWLVPVKECVILEVVMVLAAKTLQNRSHVRKMLGTDNTCNFLRNTNALPGFLLPINSPQVSVWISIFVRWPFIACQAGNRQRPISGKGVIVRSNAIYSVQK